MHQTKGFQLSQHHGSEPIAPELPQQIEAQIQGEISGQVTVGSNIVQLGSVHGGVVNFNSAEPPAPKLRPLPISLRPRPFPHLIGREAEVATVLNDLKTFEPTEICGPEGIGKTSLLRYLSHRPEASLLFPDGIVYLSARAKPMADILQALYDAFYDYTPTIKPTEAQITHDLQDKRALIILDDIKCDRDDLEDLMDIVSGSTFLISSQEQLLWSEGESLSLQGLTLPKAIALVEHKLGRSLTPSEKAAAETLCTLLHGHPLKLLQSLGRVKQKFDSLEEVVQQHTHQLAAQPSAEAVESIDYTDAERQLLSVLSTVGAAGLQAQQVAEITAIPNAAAILATLYHREIVQLEGDRYCLKESQAAIFGCTWNLRPIFQQTLAYFIQFADRHKSHPDRILAEGEALLKLLSQAAAIGLWTEVLSLGQRVETVFAVKKQWGSWEQILQLGLQAARETGERAAEALMLHQIGTRAVCLCEQEVAQHALNQAIEMREAMGDRVGAAISRHNLRMLLFVLATVTTAAAAAVIVSAGSASASVGATAAGAVGATGAVTTAGTAGAVGTATTAGAAGTTAGLSLSNLIVGGAGVVLAATGTLATIDAIKQNQGPQSLHSADVPELAADAASNTARSLPAQTVVSPPDNRPPSAAESLSAPAPEAESDTSSASASSPDAVASESKSASLPSKPRSRPTASRFAAKPPILSRTRTAAPPSPQAESVNAGTREFNGMGGPAPNADPDSTESVETATAPENASTPPSSETDAPAANATANAQPLTLASERATALTSRSPLDLNGDGQVSTFEMGIYYLDDRQK